MNQVRVGVAVFIVRDDRVLVGLRLSKHGQGTWALPGGHLEFGETPEDCAKREILEETGLTINTLINGVWSNNIFPESSKQYLTLFLLAKYEGGEAVNMEPDKCMEWKWLKLSDIPKPKFKPLESVLTKDHATLTKLMSQLQ